MIECSDAMRKNAKPKCFRQWKREATSLTSQTDTSALNDDSSVGSIFRISSTRPQSGLRGDAGPASQAAVAVWHTSTLLECRRPARSSSFRLGNVARSCISFSTKGTYFGNRTMPSYMGMSAVAKRSILLSFELTSEPASMT